MTVVDNRNGSDDTYTGFVPIILCVRAAGRNLNLLVLAISVLHGGIRGIVGLVGAAFHRLLDCRNARCSQPKCVRQCRRRQCELRVQSLPKESQSLLD